MPAEEFDPWMHMHVRVRLLARADTSREARQSQPCAVGRLPRHSAVAKTTIAHPQCKKHTGSGSQAVHRGIRACGARRPIEDLGEVEMGALA